MVAQFFAQSRTELLAQSVLFVLGASTLIFLGGLRSVLHRAEGGTGLLAAVAFAAGVLGVGVQALIHAPQVALAIGATADMPVELAGMVSDLGYVLSLIALVPLAVVLAIVATVAGRTGVFPMWPAVLSGVASLVHVVGWFAVLARSGPLAPGAWSTYVPYVLWLAWLIATTTMMVRQPDWTPSRSERV